MSPRETNFGFLDRCDERVAHLARQAEHYVHADPDSCLFKLRLMVELMAKRLLTLKGDLRSSATTGPEADLSAMLSALERSGHLPRRRADQMHAIRRDGNAAVHGNDTPTPTAMRRLKDAHSITAWYARHVGQNAEGTPPPFAPPATPDGAPPSNRELELNRAVESLEDQIESERKRTREALLLFREDEDHDGMCKRYRIELKALEMVATAAGEPLIDAEFVALVMAMDLEALYEHPSFGDNSREARRSAEGQLAKVKHDLEESERLYLADRAEMVHEMQLLKRRQLRGE